MELTDDELLRYSRQIMLPAFDVAGQLRLKQSKVLIIGAGGLGCPVALYLAAAGVGEIVLADDDQVDISNLQRQIAHTQADIGDNKVDSVQRSMLDINPLVRVRTLSARLQDALLDAQVRAADCVLDCSDNFTTRFAVNAACVKSSTPLVSGAAIRMEGHLSVFDFREEGSPCYQCLYPDMDDEGLSCSESGVLSPLVGVIGSFQALEAIKLLSGLGSPATGRLLIFDAMSADWRSLRLKRDPACLCCHADAG